MKRMIPYGGVNWGGEGGTWKKRGYTEEEDWGQGRRYAEEDEEVVTGRENGVQVEREGGRGREGRDAVREGQEGHGHYTIDIPQPLTGLAALLRHATAAALATEVHVK